MPEMARDIFVKEIMTDTPITCVPEVSAKDAALLMKREGVGSLVIVEDGEAVGILTEKDLMKKIVAEDLRPSEVEVNSVMSSPLITTDPDVSVSEAAKKMSSLGVRRLPVVEDGILVGILTENDVLRMSPSLIELTREWAKINTGGPQASFNHQSKGYCEVCGSYSDMLEFHDGRLVCSECEDMMT